MRATTPSAELLTSTTLAERYILTQVGPETLIFPAVWVAEIVRIERSQILELPFYDPLVIGIVHHNASVMPLVSAYQLLQQEQPILRELLMVLRLSDVTGSLANLGLVIDRALGSSSRAELPPALFAASAASDDKPSADRMALLNPDWFSPQRWQPQRWKTSASADFQD